MSNADIFWRAFSLGAGLIAGGGAIVVVIGFLIGVVEGILGIGSDKKYNG